MSARIEFEILGQCYSLKNTRQPVEIKSKWTDKRRTIFVPNEKAREFDRQFGLQVPRSARQKLTTPVGVSITIYYPTNQQDLDEALVLDLLQKYEVIANDRQVVSKFVQKRIDKARPRVHIVVIPVVWNREGDKQVLLEVV